MLSPKNASNTSIDNDFIVHTMAKDLEESTNPSTKTSPLTSPDQVPPLLSSLKKNPSPFSMTEKKPEQSIPQKPAEQPKSAITPPTTNNPNPFNVRTTTNSTPKQLVAQKESTTIKKILPNSPTHSPIRSFLVLLFLVFLLGGLALYFFYYRNIQVASETQNNSSTTEDTSSSSTSTSSSEGTSLVENAPLSISIDKPNYLSINTDTADNLTIKEAIKSQADDVTKVNPVTPIEFVVTDQLNNPLSFTDFSIKTGIDLPTELLASLSDKFSLFVYVDQGSPKMGLAIDIKDSTALKGSLKKEESKIITDLSPLYLDTPYSTSSVKFKDSVYKETPVRYFNIISPAKLSIDYILTPDKLIIGTTRETAANIFDYLAK